MCTFGKRKALELQWTTGFAMAHEPKDVDIESFLGRFFFRAHSFQIALATCNFFIGMVTCFQIKH